MREAQATLPAGAVVERAPAKVNLGLWVLGRRDDGYHLIDTVMARVEPVDELAMWLEPGAPPGTVSLSVTGPEAGALAREGLALAETVDLRSGITGAGANLVLKAAAELARLAPEPLPAVRIRLTKRIPVGGGLGGGSSDAAAALRGLNRLWGLGLTTTELEGIGARIGADVAFFVRGGVQRATGIGERLAPISCRLVADCVVAVPDGGVVTAQAYRLWDELSAEAAAAGDGSGRGAEGVVAAISRGDLEDVRRQLHNDLAMAACLLSPSTERLLRLLEIAGGEGACVSGSGSAVFALVAPGAGKGLADDVRRRAAAEGWTVRVYVSRLPAEEDVLPWRVAGTVVEST